MVKTKIALAGAALAAMGASFPLSGALASSAPKEGKELPPSIAIQRTELMPPPIIAERIGGLKINISQVMYPGVPDRAACRFVVRASNSGTATVSAYALLHTLNGDKVELNTWMVPTGTLAPGQSSERLYSCKSARYLVVDLQTLEGWPGRCTVNGEDRSPCPLSLTMEANLNIIAK